MSESGGRRQLCLQFAFFNGVQFQREEQQIRRDVRDSFANGLTELARFGIGHVGREGERREGADLAESFVDRLAGLDRFRQISAGQGSNGAFVTTCKRLGFAGGTIQIGFQGRRVGARIKVRQIPAGRGVTIVAP